MWGNDKTMLLEARTFGFVVLYVGLVDIIISSHHETTHRKISQEPETLFVRRKILTEIFIIYYILLYKSPNKFCQRNIFNPPCCQLNNNFLA